MHVRRPLLSLIVLASMVAVPCVARAKDADALIGRWVVNIEKSELGSGPPMKSQVRTFDYTQNGEIVVTLESVNAEGNRSYFHWYTKLDDQQHPEFQRGKARNHV